MTVYDQRCPEDSIMIDKSDIPDIAHKFLVAKIRAMKNVYGADGATRSI
jgi:hypothetical protein